MDIGTIRYMKYNADCFYEVGIETIKKFQAVFITGKFYQPDFSFITVAATNLTFSCEIYLKILIAISEDKLKSGHELDKLFSSLSKDIQKGLNDKFIYNWNNRKYNLGNYSASPSSIADVEDPDKHHIPDLHNMLAIHKSGFVNWRYMHEMNKGEISADIDGLDCFVRAIRDDIIEHGKNKDVLFFDLDPIYRKPQ